MKLEVTPEFAKMVEKQQVTKSPLFTELFPRTVRYTGVSLGCNIGTLAAGGAVPPTSPPSSSNRPAT